MWTDLKALMRRSHTWWSTAIGALACAAALLVEQVAAVQQLAAELGAPAWAPTAIGLIASLYANARRWRDHRSGDNPA